MEIQGDILKLREAGRRAREEYLAQRLVKIGNTILDEVLEGGLESGNYYLFLGSAKNGKSTILRCLGLGMARNGSPVLYVNFEQPGKNTFAKLYSMIYGQDFRSGVHNPVDALKINTNVEALPDIPFYVAFWVGTLESNAFNSSVREYMQASVDYIKQVDPEHRTPLVIMENLSDIYNERLNNRDNVVNNVTQTASDVKKFAMDNDLTILLAHHTGKLQSGDEPTMDSVLDSKRVVDLAHSVFAAFLSLDESPMGDQVVNYHLKYMAGRNSSQPKKWDVVTEGLELKLLPFTPPPDKKKGKKRFI